MVNLSSVFIIHIYDKEKGWIIPWGDENIIHPTRVKAQNYAKRKYKTTFWCSVKYNKE